MPATVAGIHLGPDTHANRPAANAAGLPIGSLYMCSDHDLIYKTDGSAWATWATLGGTGGGGWALGIDESGASFANFTSESGTWASSGTVIQQTLAGAAHRRAHHNTLLPIGAGSVVQVECRVTTAGGGDTAVGLSVGMPGANGNSHLAVVLEPSADTLQFENSGVSAVRTIAHTIDVNTWYTLRLAVGRYVTAYIDGTLKGSILNPATTTIADFVGLITYDALAEFRNLKVWTAEMPA